MSRSKTRGCDASARVSKPQRQLAAVTAVHQDGLKCTVEVQLFDQATRSYSGPVLTRLRVMDTTCPKRDAYGLLPPYAPRMALMRDLTHCLCCDDNESDVASDLSSDPVSDGENEDKSGSDGKSEGECEGTDAAEDDMDVDKESSSTNQNQPSWIRKMLYPTTSAAHRARLADPSRRATGSGFRVSISDASGPQLHRAPGFPVCERAERPSLCDCLEPSHFDAFDHPPDKWDGPHPYIAIAEAEAAGRDMTVARQLLGRLECAHDHHLLWPEMDDTGDVTAETFVSRATHVVCVDVLQPGHPAGPWAALQEARCAESEPCGYSRELEQMHQQLVEAASANADAVMQKQQPALELPRQPKPLDDLHEKQPKLLRVADRMRLWPGRNPQQRSLERPKTLDDRWIQSVLAFRAQRQSRVWSK